jgi:branched-chain amino acid transport system permease protein
MGLNVLRYKAMAFAASGLLGAVGGGLLATLSTYLDPAQFRSRSRSTFSRSRLSEYVVTVGAIVGSAVFILIPDLLQSFQSYLGLVFALLLLGFIVLRPNGLASIRLSRYVSLASPRLAGTRP